MKTIKDYCKGITESQQAEFERIRKIVHGVVPAKDVEEVISYGIPTFRYKGKPLLYFGAFKSHMSIFPGAPVSLASKLEGYTLRKGTIQFTIEKPLPEAIIKEILQHRLQELGAN